MGVILLSRSPKSILKALYEERENITIAVITLFLFVLACSLMLSYAIINPLKRLAHNVQKSDKSSNEYFIIKEIDILARNIEQMSETIRHRSDYIKSFATSVSHEFKTPLTSIRGAIELLDEHNDSISTEQKQKFYNNILQDIERLKKLVSKLLELARADLLKPSGEITDIVEVANDLAKRYSFAGLNIKINSSEQKISAIIEENILETILINLLDNSKQNGASNVNIDISVVSENIEIMVSDNGHGIPEGNETRLFEPFFTTNHDKGGTGLGLSVIRSLLNANNSTVELIKAKPSAVFKIKLRNIK